MKKYPRLLLGVVLLLGWSFDFLFWNKPVGANFAIFILLCLAGGFALLVTNGRKPALKSLFLIVPAAFFGIMAFSRQEPLTLFLAYTFTLFSVGVLAATYLGGRWAQYCLLDYFHKFFQLIGSLIARPIRFFLQIRKEQAENGVPEKRLPVAPVVRGLLIAFPIMAVFTALLASADMVFSQKVTVFFKSFNPGTTFLRLIVSLIWAYLLAGSVLHAATQSKDEKLVGEERPAIEPFIGFTEAAIVLGSVTILFLLFVMVQFRYFFGGMLNIGLQGQGFTYSEYARRGFNELVAVAFLSLLMILGFSILTRRENNWQRRIYSGLSIAVVALVMVMLDSAFQRLALAVAWHGFSRLRVYPQIFMVWVGILFVAVVVLEAMRRERHFALAMVIASLGFAVSLSLFNVDASIVRHNVSRAIQGWNFNVPYLASLSTDAIPALADEFADPSLPTTIHEGIGAALLCHLHANIIPDTSNDDWRSFNLSLWNAEMVVKEGGEAAKFKGYSVILDESSFPVRVKTPGKASYECRDTAPVSYY